jgi:hypothetical protein
VSEPTTCPECGRAVKGERGLRDHVRDKHDGSVESEASDPRSLLRRGVDAVVDTVGCFGFMLAVPVGLTVFWLAVSYVLMVALWAFGDGELSAFPEYLVFPESCWPNTPPC